MDEQDTQAPAGEGRETLSANDGERIAKVLARAGVASRRDVEAMIADGRIAKDGITLTTPATLITSVAGISVDGKQVDVAQTATLYRFHKPRGVITTHKDPQGRRTVFQMLPRSLGRLISVGRLDFNSEGLLLLTNSGDLAHQLENPKTGITRTYRVRVYGHVSDRALENLANGITVEGVRYGPIVARRESARPDDKADRSSNSWLVMQLEEGKNREIRRVLSHLGLDVNRLIRTDFGPFKLGSLARGGVALVPPSKLQAGKADMGLAPKISAAEKGGWAKAKPKRKKPPSGRRTMPKSVNAPKRSSASGAKSASELSSQPKSKPGGTLSLGKDGDSAGSAKPRHSAARRRPSGPSRPSTPRKG